MTVEMRPQPSTFRTRIGHTPVTAVEHDSMAGLQAEPSGTAPPQAGGPTFVFGPFRLRPAQRLLLEDNSPVGLGSRALDILLALVERPGEVVGKDELIARVWPDTFVEDVNVRVHMSALRRTLGEGLAGRRYIATIPGRGYQFVGAVISVEDSATVSQQTAATPRTRSLPMPATRIIGRAEVAGIIAELLPQRRFVTIVGPGGIGKTTMAVAVADGLQSTYPDGVHFLDLAPVAGSGLVPAALAFTLGLPNFSADPTPGIVARLRDKRALLLLDSCEHVVEGAAVLVEQVLKGALGVHVLATSREPLRAEGERMLRLPPLDIPPVLPSLTAAQALAYPAVQLFVERASATLEAFTLSDADAPAVAEICSRLGGIALAIELAASHVAAFDLRSLAALLNDRFRLLARGRRTALSRHQTMRAVLDWSYETLPDQDGLVLRRLAVFDGAISLPAARAVAGQSGLSGDEVVARLANLVDKSLVTAEISEAGVHYRLLDTTRAYALEKLDFSGERDAADRWHAEHCLAVFGQARAEWASQSPTVWLAAYGREIGNARTALDWAFSPRGDTTLALDLSTVAVPIMFEVSLVEECRRRAVHALAVMSARAPADEPLDKPREMRLRATLGAALMYSTGPVPQTAALWRTVLEDATALDDAEFQARALWALWTASIYGGAPREALGFAEQFSSLAAERRDTAKLLMGERLIGVALHALGEQQAARERLEGLLARYAPSVHRWHTLGSQIDQGLMARSTLSRILWLQGFPDRALKLREQALQGVRAQGHAIALCYVLFASAIPVAFEAGDIDAARAALDLLQDVAAQNGLTIWLAGGRCVRLVIEARSAPVPVERLHASLADLRTTGYLSHGAWLSGLMAEAVGRQDDTAAGLTLVNQALTDCERSGEQWYVAELLRIKGELTAQDPAAATGVARELMQKALDIARRQGALSWELRAATSLARLWRDGGQGDVAGDLLESVLARFSEGFGTANLLAARHLLNELEVLK